MPEYYVEFHFDYVNIQNENEEIILPLILVSDIYPIENLITIIQNATTTAPNYRFKIVHCPILCPKSFNTIEWTNSVEGRLNTLMGVVYKKAILTLHFPLSPQNQILNSATSINGIGVIYENELNIIGNNKGKWKQKNFLLLIKNGYPTNEFINIDIR